MRSEIIKRYRKFGGSYKLLHKCDDNGKLIGLPVTLDELDDDMIKRYLNSNSESETHKTIVYILNDVLLKRRIIKLKTKINEQRILTKLLKN